MKHVIDIVVQPSQQRVDYPLLPVESVGSELPDRNNEKLYFSSRFSSENLLTKLTQAVKEAREVVAFQTLLLDDSPFTQELEQAVKERGVRVYGIVASERLRKLAEAMEVHSRERDFEQLLRRLYPLMLLRFSSRIHAKYLLIDPHLPTRRAFLLTANLTRKALSENIEIGKELEGEEAKLLFEYFLYAFWEGWSEDELNEYGNTVKTTPLQKYRLPSSDKLACSLACGGGYSLYQGFRETIQEAEDSIALATYLIAGVEQEPIASLYQSLCKAVERGVKVQLFYPLPKKEHQKEIFPILHSLVDVGVRVYLIKEPLLHAKFILSDGRRGWLTTANLEGKTAQETMDLGWRLSEGEAKVMEKYLAWLMTRASYCLSPSCHVSELKDTTFYLMSEGELREARLREKISHERSETLKKVKDLIDFYEEKRGQAQRDLEILAHQSKEYALAFELRRFGQLSTLGERPYDVVEKKESFRVITFSDSEKKQGESKAVLLRVDEFDPQRDLSMLREHQNLPLYAE